MNMQSVRAQRALALMLLLVVLAFYAFVYWLVPEMTALFADMNVVIPRHTQLVLDTYLYWSVFLIAAAIGFTLVWWRQTRHGWYLLTIGTLSVIIFLPVTVWAMYGPVLP